MIKLLLLALLASALPLESEAAIRFALRGTSTTPRYGLGGKKTTAFIAPATAASPPVVASLGHASVFGGQAIDFRLLGDTRGQIYRLGESWINGSNVFSLLVRIVPDWTGVPPFANRVVKTVSPTGTGDAAGGFYMEITDAGKLLFHGRYNVDAGGNILTFQSASALSFTSGTATDIMVVSNGTNYYASQDGVEIATGALTDATKNFDNVIASNMLVCPYPCDLYVNELVIWDTAEAHVYATRSAFTTADDFDGTLNTDPGVANVLSTAGAYTIAGLSKTPTYVAASTSNVKTGVTFGASSALTGTYDGSDRWTSLLESVVEVGQAYTANGVAKTGTYTGANRWTDIPEAKVENAYAYKAGSLTNNKTGSLNPTVNSAPQALVGAPNYRPIVITQGDTITLDLALKTGDGSAFNLTGATFETKVRSGSDTQVTLENSQHTIVSASAGTITLALTAVNTAAFGLGSVKDIQIKVTQGSNVKYFHGYGILTVLPNGAER